MANHRAQAAANNNKLPAEVLVKVLQHVGPQQRLGSCALVGSTWRVAANLLTNSIAVKKCTPQQCSALSLWLQRQGSTAQVSSLEVAGPKTGAVLPELQLSSGLTDLSRLELHECVVPLQGLSALTALRHLDVEYNGHADPVMAGSNAAIGPALQQLSALTHLRLSGRCWDDTALSHISCLSQLQQLILKSTSCTAASFAILPQSLTQVEVLKNWELALQQVPGVMFSPNTTPGLCQLTGLRTLVLADTAGVCPAVLAGLVQLTKLELAEVAVSQAPGLGVLSLLTHLQHLELGSVTGAEDDGAGFAVLPAVDAVTASSHLTHLALSSWHTFEDWGSVFPAGRLLPHLIDLKFSELFLHDPASAQRVSAAA